MTNHPHDCPVCEEGGNCHLQDMTVMTGIQCANTASQNVLIRIRSWGRLLHMK